MYLEEWEVDLGLMGKLESLSATRIANLSERTKGEGEEGGRQGGREGARKGKEGITYPLTRVLRDHIIIMNKNLPKMSMLSLCAE